MKKGIFLCLLALMMATGVCAAEETVLPQGVIDLCEDIHPGYDIAAQDGWGDENFGQFALVLRRGEDNILCMAEKAQDDTAYRMTIDNTNAVYDGEKIPSLMIEGGGNSLFYTYYDGENNSLHLHTIKQGGAWLDMDVTLYLNEGGRYRSINSGVWDGALRYQHHEEDENGNILNSASYEPVPVDEAFAARMLPQNFDINAYIADPEYGVSREMLPGLCGKLLEPGETLVDLEIKWDDLAMAVQRADGSSCVRIAHDYGGGYAIQETLKIEGRISFDALHAGRNQVMLHIGDYGDCTFEKKSDSMWYLASTYADEGVQYGFDMVASFAWNTISRNDGYAYGTSPWGRIDRTDFSSLPRTAAQALDGINQSAYALVSNPDPADRLHLRVRPDKRAESLGKFYNRTPVYILERGDTWTKVRIGNEEDSLTGYMMTKFLVFEEDEKETLACAFPQKQLIESYADIGVTMYTKPVRNSEAHNLFENKQGDFIIGVVGDEWFVVMRSDGAVGYVPQRMFWDGNG